LTGDVAANVVALEPVYEQWGQGNWRSRFDVYATGLEWGWSDEFPGLAGVFEDNQPRNQRLLQWLSPWEDWRCEAEEYVLHDHFVVVLCRYSGRGKESGVVVETPGAHVWRMSEGKAVRLEIFSSRERALAAAGVRDRA
jgi:ketosteroid isomerase-like protein